MSIFSELVEDLGMLYEHDTKVFDVYQHKDFPDLEPADLDVIDWLENTVGELVDDLLDSHMTYLTAPP